VDGTELARSIRVVAEHRSVTSDALDQVLDGYGALGQVRWAAWVRKQRLEDHLPRDFATVVDAVVRFSEPALQAEILDQRWYPSDRAWLAR
jgi:hypothetical protein